MDEILEYENLVYSIAKYFKNYPNKEDLYQVGRMGLIKAYQNYQNDRGCKFSTYAYTYILGEMKKLTREDKGIKISRQITKLNLQIEKAYVLLSQKLMKEPSIKEIANYLEIDEYYVSEAINSLHIIKSIDEPINDDGSYSTLQDIVGYNINYDEKISLKDELNKLSSEELDLINNRYMKDLSQTETSKLMNMSQVQVSRKEQKILKKLRQEMTV